MKVCPFCAEQVEDSAIKCRYCHEMLTPASTIEARVQADPIYQKAETIKQASLALGQASCALGCLVPLILVTGLIILGAVKQGLSAEAGRIILICLAVGLPILGLAKMAPNSTRVVDPREQSTKPPAEPKSMIPLAVGLFSFAVLFCVAGMSTGSADRSRGFQAEAESLLSSYDKVVFFFEPRAGRGGSRSFQATAAAPTRAFIERYKGLAGAEPRALFIKKLKTTAEALDRAKTDKDMVKCKQQIAGLREELTKL